MSIRYPWWFGLLIIISVASSLSSCGGSKQATPIGSDLLILESGVENSLAPPVLGGPLDIRTDWIPGEPREYEGYRLTCYYPRGRSEEAFAQPFYLEVADDGASLRLMARRGLAARRTLLFEIEPPVGLGASNVEFAQRYATGSALTFAPPNVPGLLPLGVVKLHPVVEPAGEAVIAEISFGAGSAARRASAAPVGDGNVVVLEDGSDEDGTIAWHEKNYGDTNNDGIVSIADITPIAMYYGMGSGVSPATEMADADGSGTVGISDITPIAMGYGSVVEGYAIYRTIAGSLGEAETQLAAIPDGSYYDQILRPGISAPPRVRYVYSDPDPQPSTYYQVAPFEGDEVGCRSTVVKGGSAGPAVTIVTPEEGTVIDGLSLPVVVTAVSPLGVDRVELRLTGFEEPLATLTEEPYETELDTSQWADGNVILTALAYDANENSGADSVNLTVSEHNPQVAFVSPIEGEDVGAELNIELDVTALSTIESVEVFLDDAEIPLVSWDAPPYTAVVSSDTIPNGERLLAAVAVDDLAREGTGEVSFNQLGANISITAPDDDETIYGQVTVTVTTDAPPDTTVFVYVNEGVDPAGSDDAAPYEILINAYDIPEGTNTLWAEVTVDMITRRDSVDVEVPPVFEQAVYASGLPPDVVNFTPYGGPGDEWYYNGQLQLPEYASYWRNDHLYMPEYTQGIVDSLETGADSIDAIVAWADDRFGLSSGLPSFTPTIDPSEPLAEAVISLMEEIGDEPNETQIRNDASDVPLGLQQEVARILQHIEEAIPYRNDGLNDMGIAANLSEYYSWAHWILVRCSGSVTDHTVSGEMRNMVRAARLVAAGVDDALANGFGSVGGTYDFTVDTSAGRIVVNDTGADSYDNRDYLLIVDAGGNDTYTAPAGANNSADNGISVCLDLDGSDVHNRIDDPLDVDRVNNPPNDNTSQQGVGRCGVGMLVDIGADGDQYSSVRLSQGLGIYGIGVLYDDGGSDSYNAEALSQGASFNGIGILADLGGSDDYYMYAYGQGFGFVLGVGVLYDGGADVDNYHAEREYDPVLNDYQSPQNTEKNGNFCQGAGFGLRGSDIAGGLGLIYDGGGNDSYYGGVFCTGTAYFFSTGIVYDAGGDDTYATQWYGCSGNAHQSACILMDKAGDDSYENLQSCGVGSGHDVSVAWVIDEAGDDIYNGAGHSLGASNECGAGYLVDFDGTDQYNLVGGAGSASTLGRGYFSNELVNDAWEMHWYRNTHYYNFGFFVDCGGDEDIYDAKFADIPTLEPFNYSWDDPVEIHIAAGNGLIWVRGSYVNGLQNPGNPPDPTGPNSYWSNEYGCGIDADGGTPM